VGAALVLSRPAENRAFGGTKQVIKGVVAEVCVSAILAPILMVANTKAVVQILSGHDAGWHTQQRDTDGLAWSDAFRAMKWQMITGVGFSIALAFRPDLISWFAAIVLPLLFAAPIAVWTSRRRHGDAVAAKGYMVIPDEDGTTSTAPIFVATPVEERIAA